MIITLIMIFSIVSCAMVDLPLDENYRRMLQQRQGGEHEVGTISVLTGNEMALTGQVSREFRPLSAHRVSVPESQAATRKHPAAEQLDLLLAEARRQFPNDQVELRNPTAGYQRTGSRQVGPQGQTQTQNLYRRELRAVVVSTLPMPAPVTHSADISLQGRTRADTYRRAHNYLTDTNHRQAAENIDFQAIEFQQADIDLGRIRGTYTFVVVSGRSYRISSTFTIDIHDARASISFAETNPPIFLQSVAELAKQELERFTTALVSSITS